MRPDWENVLLAILDALLTYSGVDPARDRRPWTGHLGASFTRLGPLMDKVHDSAADEQIQVLLGMPALKPSSPLGWSHVVSPPSGLTALSFPVTRTAAR